MKIERIARILVGAAASCLLLVNAGCNGTASTALDPGSSQVQIASVQGPLDWGSSLLAGGKVGNGQFPAKFTFDVTAAPDCVNDYLAYNTSLAGAAATAAASQTVTFGGSGLSGTPAGTITITNGSTTLTLTGAGSSSGTNFAVVADNSTGNRTANATSLAAAINLAGNGSSVGVNATSAAGVVTIKATANGAGGNSIALGGTMIGSQGVTDGGAAFTGGVGTANIVAFNQLYSTQGSVGGLCNQNGPSVDWAYYTGTGTAVTSVVISGLGDKVAFVENVGTQAYLRILQWKAGEGAGAGFPVAPDQTLAANANWSTCTSGNSCIVSIAFSGTAATDTNSAPFYVYNTDTLYVGDNSGRMHKFTNVFLGAPTEVTTNWPITVHAGDILTSPVYDSVSQNLFVGDNVGRLSFIKEVGSTIGAGACAVAGTPAPTPCLGTANVQVGTAGAIVDTPIVDGTTGLVLAVNGTDTSANRGTISQATTALTGAVSFKIGGSGAGSALYGGAFDNTYYATGPSSGHMYICGKDPGNTDRPSIYQLTFNSSGTLTAVGTSVTGLVSANDEACSPITEFYNPNGAGTGVARDWIFFSFGNRAAGASPIPAGTCRTSTTGCVVSVNVTGEPSWPPSAATFATLSVADAVPANATGATSGIVVDNTSTSGQASSFYFSLGTNSTGAGPGIPSCNTTAGVGCAVKLTQSALN